MQREQFREGYEIRAIIGGNIDKIFHLLFKFGLRSDFAHLELYGRDTNRLRQTVMRTLGHKLRFDRQRIFPEHMDSIAAGRFVGRHVVFQDAERHEALVQLKIDHRIAELLVENRGQIIGRVGKFALAPLIAGQSAAKDYAF